MRIFSKLITMKLFIFRAKLILAFSQQQILTVQNLQDFHNLTNYYRTWLIKTLAPVWLFLNVYSALTFTSFDLEDNQTQKCNPMTEVSNCSWKRTNLRDSIRKKNMKRWEEEKQFGNKVLYVCHGVNLILFKYFRCVSEYIVIFMRNFIKRFLVAESLPITHVLSLGYSNM